MRASGYISCAVALGAALLPACTAGVRSPAIGPPLTIRPPAPSVSPSPDGHPDHLEEFAPLGGPVVPWAPRPYDRTRPPPMPGSVGPAGVPWCSARDFSSTGVAIGQGNGDFVVGSGWLVKVSRGTCAIQSAPVQVDLADRQGLLRRRGVRPLAHAITPWRVSELARGQRAEVSVREAHSDGCDLLAGRLRLGFRADSSSMLLRTRRQNVPGSVMNLGPCDGPSPYEQPPELSGQVDVWINGDDHGPREGVLGLFATIADPIGPVRAGMTAQAVVDVVNASDDAVLFAPCFGYEVVVVINGTGGHVTRFAAADARLPCAELRVVPAHGRVRFAARILVPADVAPGPGYSLEVTLASGATARSELTVTASTDFETVRDPDRDRAPWS